MNWVTVVEVARNKGKLKKWPISSGRSRNLKSVIEWCQVYWGGKETKQEAKWWQGTESERSGCHTAVKSILRAQGKDRSECLNQEWGDFEKLPRLEDIARFPQGEHSRVFFWQTDLIKSFIFKRERVKKVSSYIRACPLFPILTQNSKHKTASQDHVLKRHRSAMEKLEDAIMKFPLCGQSSPLVLSKFAL